jgi:inhibitor of KinA
METAEDYLKQASFHPVGETALMVSFGHVISPEILRCTSALMKELKAHPFPGTIECTASYTGVTIFYNPSTAAKESTLKEPQESKGYSAVMNHVKALLKNIVLTDSADSPVVKIPVCFGGEYGPDLEDLAAQHHLTPEEVIRIYTEADYLVYMIGFAPGYPYMGGLPETLATPRRKTPRLVIPKGSVAIGGAQAGIYPMESPGGFNLIGRTPLELFRPENKEDPTVLHSGDHVKFYAVSSEEYQEISQKEGAQPCK